ncbi:hypothetical protein ABB37_08138 [Leptomonas pyrrhocoris]|uniref:C3H1-type domain-containing protein n=1 Tax=Leptomonas pyrrhocoris TaxID=157538 RepID=A0A0M9FU94_LEPPY|nr:hypothetical protein ABB37_08138 [Leptomonas pyrrhocoris]KPA75986.1 hypothetical protein ABB37_08138 [Leptomonas pyrrhocoris]|eukprot:XP_015654425.1 hypothetical protein ABB37_08138 [Leptomonas pyrrhocoris]
MSAFAYKEPTAAPATAARHRKPARVNYVIEACTPAMLCLVRGAQAKAYTPLSLEDVYEAVQPHDLALRPSPYIAHQALLDFYKICDGYNGVEMEAVDLQQLTVGSHSKGHHSGAAATAAATGVPTQHGSNASASTPAGPSFSSAAAAAASASTSALPALPPLPSPDDPNIAEKLNDYRIAQLRRNAQHVDNSVYHAGSASASSSSAPSASASAGGGGGGAGVCHFYRTPGGCYRGAQCPFLHLDKAGQPLPKAPFGIGKRS